jgi:hypothetical protein
MDILVSLLDAVGFVLLISVLFLPVVWFVAYSIWESLNWKATEARRYTFEEFKEPELEKPVWEEPRKAA